MSDVKANYSQAIMILTHFLLVNNECPTLKQQTISDGEKDFMSTGAQTLYEGNQKPINKEE